MTIIIIICFNCKNQGHTVAQCNLDAWSYCERFHVGHKSSNCPKRNNIQSKRNANYEKDEVNHQGKKNNTDNNNKKVKTNHPKKRGIKRVKSELSDHESECDDEDDESDDEGDEESAYVITKSIRAIKRTFNTNMDDNMAIIDTGADE